MRRRALLVLPIVMLVAGCGSGPSGSFEPAQAGTLTVMTQPLPTAGFWEGTGDRPTGGLEPRDVAIAAVDGWDALAGPAPPDDVGLVLVTDGRR